MTLQQLLGIELPVIQAPIAGVQGSALAVAVSNAGGLGSLPCAMLSLEAIRSRRALAAWNLMDTRAHNSLVRTPVGAVQFGRWANGASTA
jgi:nitronate monooxygenase